MKFKFLSNSAAESGSRRENWKLPVALPTGELGTRN
jgi:hypothetical protein